jgi:hypothetical protein
LRLGELPDVFAGDPDYRRFADIWLSTRVNDIAPRNADFEPKLAGLKGVAFVVLDAVAPDQVVCTRYDQFAGDVKVGFSRLGQNIIAEMSEGPRKRKEIEYMWRMAHRPCGAVARRHFPTKSGFYLGGVALVLPVLPDCSETPVRIFVLEKLTGNVETALLEPDPGRYPFADSFDFIDIGAGVEAVELPGSFD